MINKMSKIKEYFETCEYLSQTTIEIDYLSSEAAQCAIIATEGERAITVYTNGDQITQLLFSFCIRASYTAETIAQTSFLCEKIISWIEEQNAKKILPDIENIQVIECLGNGTITEVNNTTVQYQIPMRIVYKIVRC